MPMIRDLLRWSALAIAACAAHVGAQTTTRIVNTATLTYQPDMPGAPERTISSNSVTMDVPRTKVPTAFTFHLLPPGFELSGVRCEPGEQMRLIPAGIDAATLDAAPVLESLDVTTPFVIALRNAGANHDPQLRETVSIDVGNGAASGSMMLTETARDSGVFAGGIPATGTVADLKPCDLTLHRGVPVTLRFAEDGYSYGSMASQLVDPAGHVFDSATSALVDGAVVTLLDDTGQPARVFGDDGTSAYPATVTSGAAVTDASGRVYPAIPGRYRFPLVAQGQYRLTIQPPAGYTAPSGVDAATLATRRDAGGEPFILNVASFGGAMVLAGPEPFYADIPVDHAESADILVAKTASVREASPGDFVQYRIQVTNRGAGIARGLSIADTLPAGLRYETGSTRGGAEPIAAADGRTLAFAVADIAPGASAEVRYIVTIAPGAPIGEAVNRARATGAGGLVTNEAAASVRIRALLFSDALTIIGRVTEGRCGDPASGRRGVAGIRLLLEDGTFVVTDRDGLYHFEGVRAGRHVVQLDTRSIPVTHTAIACDADTRQAGSAISRFVEGPGGLMKRIDFQLAPTGRTAPAADALPMTVADDATAAGARDWLAGQQPGVAWLFPEADHNPRSPAIRVAIKHLPGQRVALTVNGVTPDALAFDTTDSDVARGVAVSRWSGLPVVPGANRLVARVLDAEGRTVQTLERVVTVAGPAARATFDAAHSRLVADGLARPLMAVRVTDTAGHPVRAGTLVPFRIDAPYRAYTEVALEQGRQLAGRERNQVSAKVVGDDGLAFITLEPTTQAGAVRVVVALTDDRQVRTSELRAWLSPAAQDWVVVGFGAGTLGYDTLRSRTQALPVRDRNQVVTDGQLAFYAKGRVKGSWLATIAYDSDRRYDPSRGLLGTIDPDRYYTVYGDGSLQGYDAPTRGKLYLRLERREFYALFGDFESGFTETQLTRYNRTLNGVKAAYEGRNLRATGFAAQTRSLYGRDEIQGNGLSGPYRLSGRDIVPNSDKLRLETRDRFRSELIRASVALTRHIDYDIDTVSGTVRFRNPILSRDPAQNPVFIVAEYEVAGGRTGQIAAAARVAARLADGRVELGAAAIRDEAAGADVVGVDAKVQLGAATVVRAELATGGRDGIASAQAFSGEVEHHGKAVDLLAYARQQDATFGVGQQNLVEAGTRKLGLDGRWQIADRISLTGTAWHQAWLDGAGERIAADVRVEYRRAKGTIFVGGQFADDTGVDGKPRTSRLLTLGGTQALFGGAVELTAQTQVAPGGDKDSVDFPVRHQLLAAWRVTPGIRLIGGYEIADGAEYVAHTAQVGFDLAPWTGAKLMSTLNQQAVGENGTRTFAQYGLSQSLTLGKRWSVDATLDAASTVSGEIPRGAVVAPLQPVASGGFFGGGSSGPGQVNGDFVAATLGATYRANRWSWTGRIEYRAAEANDRFGIVTSVLRSLGEGQTIASSIKAFRLVDASGAVAVQASADIALALRPLGSRWSLLERLELRHDGADAAFDGSNVLGVPAFGAGDQVTTRLVNNLAINYRTGAEGVGHGFEASAYYGAKYVRGRYANDVHTGFIDVTGFELRHDLSPRLDIGVQGSVQHAWSRGAVAFSGGPSLGLSPAANLWLGTGYNVSGYRDRDFSADRYTRAGPYVTLRMKFDQTSIAGAGAAIFGGK